MQPQAEINGFRKKIIKCVTINIKVKWLLSKRYFFFISLEANGTLCWPTAFLTLFKMKFLVLQWDAKFCYVSLTSVTCQSTLDGK